MGPLGGSIMLPALLLAGSVLILTILSFYWIILSRKFHLNIQGLSFSGFRWLRLFYRLPGIEVDFSGHCTDDPAHLSIWDPFFSRGLMGHIIWGSRMALVIENCSLKLSSSRMKLVIRIGRISVFYNILPDLFNRNSSTMMQQKKRSRLGQKFLRAIQLLISVEIDEIDVSVTTIPDKLTNLKSLFIAGARIKDISLFKDLDHLSLQSRPPFSAEKVDLRISEFGVERFELLDGGHHDLGNLNNLLIHFAVTDDSLRLDLCLDTADLYLTLNFILFAANIVDLAKSKTSKSDLKLSADHDLRVLCSCKVNSASLTALLPDIKDNLKPISKVRLNGKSLVFDCIWDYKQLNYLGSAEKFTFGAFYSESPNPKCFTKFDKILQRIPDGGDEHILISMNDLNVSNSDKLRKSTRVELHTKESIENFISTLLDGQISWNHLKNHGDVHLSSGTYAFLQPLELSKKLEFLLFSEFDPYSNVIMMSELSFLFPFEFPLSSMIEALVVMIKSPIMMFDPDVTPQRFNLFLEKWELVLSCPKISWRFGDDPFESQLARAFRVKSAIYSRFERLEKMFWKQLQKETLSMKNGQGSEEGQFSVPVQLARSSSHSDLLGENGPMVNKYRKLQEELFSLYKLEINKDEDGGNKDLMDIKIADVDLKLKWDPKYIGGRDIHELLNSLENSGVGYTKEMVENFSVFLGCFIEFSGHQLNFYLRDHNSEFISIDQFQISGPLFLLEEQAYADACVKVFPSTDSISGQSNICKDTVQVTETILPIKIFHTLSWNLTGDYGFKASFCPYWDGMFVGLDRAFDMLSKKSLEKSPPLAIWDKFRLFVHSSFGYITSSAPCSFTFYPGKARSMNEALVIQLEKGFAFEMMPTKSVFEFEEFEGLIESKSLSFLRHLLDKKLSVMQVVKCVENSSLMKLIHFSKTKFSLTLDMKNVDGRDPVNHRSIQMSAGTGQKSIENHDSFFNFRLASIIANLEVETIDENGTDVTSLNLYDELINWIRKNLMGYTETSVRKGVLFVSPFIADISQGQASIMTIMDEIHFQFKFNGLFSCIYFNFFDSDTFSGLNLTSTESRIALDYAKTQGSDDQNVLESEWMNYYAEVDFKNVNLDVVSSDPITQIWDEKFRSAEQIRLLPATIYSMLLVTAPRLFYTSSDEHCFKHDSKAQLAQVRSAQLHSKQKRKVIEELEVMLANSSTSDQKIEKELLILKEHQKMIEEVSIAENINKHFYFIHEAKLYWHEGLRNSVYFFIDQQFVRHVIRKSQSRRILDILKDVGIGRPNSPTGKNSPIQSASGVDNGQGIRKVYEELLKRPTLVYAEQEDSHGSSVDTFDIRSALEVAQESNGALGIEKMTEIFFYNVQLFLSDEIGSTAVVTAPETSVQIGSLVDEIEGSSIGSRTKVSLENMCIFASSTEADWGKPAEYQKVTEPTSAAVVFNSKDMHYTGLVSLEDIGMDRGNTVTVYAPELKLFMTSPQYLFVQKLITRLLVYRDPGQHERAQQLEALVLASDVLDKSAIINTVAALQLKVHSLEESLARICHSGRIQEENLVERSDRLKMLLEELGLIVESMLTIKSDKEKWSKKQVRLQLDVAVDSIELTMLRIDHSPMIALTLRDIHDSWVSDEDFSMSNLLQIGVILAMNKTPGSFYKTLISPLPQGFYQASGIGLGYSDKTLRFYWKSLLPVGGIPVIDHAEVNLSPLNIQLSYEIAKEAIAFFLPPDKTDINKADFEVVEDGERAKPTNLSRNSSLRTTTPAKSLSRMESMEEILSMKQKATNHCSFVSLRVPASQHFISYKGKPGTTITDIENFMLKLPSFEYHNRVLSWREVFLQVKKDAARVAFMNAGSLIKEKIKRLGQSNLSEEEKLTRTPTKQKPSPMLSTDTNIEKARKLSQLLGKSYKQDM